MSKENIPGELAQIILGKAGKGERFWIELLGLKIPFQIRPVSGQGEVRIGQERSKLSTKDITEGDDLFICMMDNYKNVIVFSKIIAVAALHSSWKILLFKRIVARLIRRGTNEEIAQLMQIVRKQSNAERFFFTMTLTLKYNQFLTKNPKEEIAGPDVQHLSAQN